MDPEVEVVAVEPASDAPVTATEALEVDKPVEAVAKTFTQEELDAAISKRLAREQRKWDRERQVAPVTAPAEPPKQEQFETTEAYARALAVQEAEKLLEARDIQRQQSEVIEAYHDREEEARAKYDDFEQVAYNQKLRITDTMAQTIQSSELGPDIAYYLGTNPTVADRISKLAPLVQAKEIGRIEAKLASDPPVKKTSNAPAPIVPVTPRSSGSPAYDTTDPRSIKSMTTSQWIDADRARQMRALEARNR